MHGSGQVIALSMVIGAKYKLRHAGTLWCMISAPVWQDHTDNAYRMILRMESQKYGSMFWGIGKARNMKEAIIILAFYFTDPFSNVSGKGSLQL